MEEMPLTVFLTAVGNWQNPEQATDKDPNERQVHMGAGGPEIPWLGGSPSLFRT